MKKIVCLILSLIMLTAVLVGCKGNNEGAGTESAGDTTVSTGGDAGNNGGEGNGGEENRAELVIENLGDANGNPRDITMLVRNNRYHYLWQDTEDSDRVKSETFKRNSDIEEKYNVNLLMAVPKKDEAADWSTALTSSSGEYDIAVPDYWWLLERQGFFLTLNDRSEFDLSEDFWYQGYNENVTINNRCYTVCGDASLEVLENIEVIFFNKQMAANQKIDLYKLVDNGEWTIDKMLEMCKDTSANLDDGDTKNDVYGAIYDIHSGGSQGFSAGLKLTQISASNGSVEIIAENSINSDIVDKVKSLIHSPYNKYSATLNRNNGEKVKLFSDEQAFMYATSLYTGKFIKDYVQQGFYGVVVMPKYSTEGEYISTIYGASAFAIPTSAKDPHASALIINALNYLSYDTTVRGFYEVVMKSQVADVYDDARMMDLAKDSMYIDFAFINDSKTFSLWTGAFQKAMLIKDTGLSSVLASALQTSRDGLTEILEFYSK